MGLSIAVIVVIELDVELLGLFLVVGGEMLGQGRVPLFSGLTEQQIERLAAGSVRRNFPRGRVIVTEGEPSQSLYILLSGRAKV